MKPLLAISGSLRTGSYNTALLRQASALVAPTLQLDIVTLHGIPLYDGDLERESGVPAAVLALQQRIIDSAGVILATPEYNSGIPGVFKNAIDWLSRPTERIPTVFGDRPIAVLGASPGGFGTVQAQSAWLPVLRALGVRLWSGQRLLVSRAHTLFDPEGGLTDPATSKRLSDFVSGFHTFCNRA